MAVKVLLDTDIGTDIDDAIALTYLLCKPECNLLGITTVTGEPEKRAMLASSICRHVGKEVPIYPGAPVPLKIRQKQKLAVQARELKKWPHDRSFPKGEAIEFLRKTIRNNPGEVVLLTIGPLTNIAHLFTVDPEIPSMLKSLVMMCGYYEFKFRGKSRLEWNAKGDYHASEIVFNSNVPIHRSIGLDVTSRVFMSSEEFRIKFNLDIFKPLQDYARHWYNLHSYKVTFHDPLAAVSIFNQEVCTFTKGNISICLRGKDSAGLTKWKCTSAGVHEIATKVNKELFFQEYFSVFNK